MQVQASNNKTEILFSNWSQVVSLPFCCLSPLAVHHRNDFHPCSVEKRTRHDDNSAVTFGGDCFASLVSATCKNVFTEAESSGIPGKDSDMQE